jgi:hypothetical protein
VFSTQAGAIVLRAARMGPVKMNGLDARSALSL